MSETPIGIDNPGTVDAVVLVGDRAELELWQTAPWDGSDRQLLLVQEKLFNYLSFVADGDLARAHPGVRQWTIVVRCWEQPGDRMAHLLRVTAGEAAKAKGSVELRLDGQQFRPTD